MGRRNDGAASSSRDSGQWKKQDSRGNQRANSLLTAIFAGLVGTLAVILFMLIYYRFFGIFSSVALIIYTALTLGIFKLFGVTMTLSGIAGFILSIGMAVDANILIFERVKEEMRQADNLHEAITRGFTRAWASIRDSNLSSIISASILFWFGTSLIRGFALTLAIGVLISMLTAINVTRIFLLAIGAHGVNRRNRFLFGSGFTR